MGRLTFTLEDSKLKKNVSELDAKIDLAIRGLVDYQSTRGEGLMKIGAPWHDNTGAARAGLHTMAFHQGSKHTILFAHSVSYGIWLEVRWSGKYEIIMPTVRMTGKDLMQSFGGLMGKLR